MARRLAVLPPVVRTMLLAAGLAALLIAWAEADDPPLAPPAAGPGSRPDSAGSVPARSIFGVFFPSPPSPVGEGKTRLLRCRAATQCEYWLYLPKDYNSERRYPLVVSLHGMRPYDVAEHHVKMWGPLADKYGYIVLAPNLKTSDSLGQFPVRKIGREERADIDGALACIDEVITDWQVDQSAVLLTCWSMGGYLANYLAVEHGNRFAAFAALQSNFCNEILDVKKARQLAGRLPVFVFYGSKDLPVVVQEAKDSVEWYTKLGFNVVTKNEEIGHQRHPELAAEFFEKVLAGAVPPAGQATTRPVVDKDAVARWIPRLGDSKYPVREEATKALIEMGDPIRGLLEATLKEPNLDPEIANRLERILESLPIPQPVAGRNLIVIAITPPGNDPAPVAVNLWPSLSSKIGEVRTYLWDFGKLGGPSYMKSPNVLIRQPGEYPVRLTVVTTDGKRYFCETRLKVPAVRAPKP